MIILPGTRTPEIVFYGHRPIQNIFVGTRLVWPEAQQIGFRAVSLCKTHAAFVLNDGSLWTTGSNRHGQLGRISPGGSWQAPDFASVPGVSDARSVVVSHTADGEGSTVVLREHGRMFSAGYSNSPKLAVTANDRIAWTSLGRQGISGSPTFCNFSEVLGISDVRKLWHGRGRLIVQRGNGSVQGFGLDWDANRVLFQWMRVTDSGGLPLACIDLSLRTKCLTALHADGSVGISGPMTDWFRPKEFYAQYTAVVQPNATELFWTGMRKIASGRDHIAGITPAVRLFVAGSDEFGQLGSPRFRFRNPERGGLWSDEPVLDVACGDHHTVFLCKGGKVKTAGRNHRGQLGRAVPVGNGHDWVYSTGADRVSEEGWFGNCGEIPGIDDATAVYAGGDMTLIVRRSGLFVCGDNEWGQLGVATDRHIVNGADRITWRKNWRGIRTPFETNLCHAEYWDGP